MWNRTPDKARVLAADGADLADTPADAVREAAFVITMLTDTAAVLAVMRQAAKSVPDGAVWLQTSMDTAVERVAGLAEDHWITFVDCPVPGTRETAKQGRLVVLASGPGDALDQAQPIFDAIGSKSVRLEPDAGRASRIKLVANAWTVALWESLRSQLSRAARWAYSRTSARRSRYASVTSSTGLASSGLHYGAHTATQHKSVLLRRLPPIARHPRPLPLWTRVRRSGRRRPGRMPRAGGNAK